MITQIISIAIMAAILSAIAILAYESSDWPPFLIVLTVFIILSGFGYVGGWWEPLIVAQNLLQSTVL